MMRRMAWEGMGITLTPAINLTIARLLFGTIDRLHPKNDMPQKLHHAPTLRIAFPRLNHPLPKRNIIFPRPLPYSFPRDRKLGTACAAYFPRIWISFSFFFFFLLRRKERRRGYISEDLPPSLFRNVFILPMRRQAAGIPVAAEIYIAVFLHEGDA